MSLSLKQRVINSGVWVLVGYAGQQILRFGSNLVLTRLLFPEAFGLMAIVQTIMVGLNLLSDVGIGTSIIQHKRGEDADFLNTAWALQILRGFFLFLAAWLAAPWLADFYHQPMLAELLPVVALGTLVNGFRSTKGLVANRALNMQRNTIIDLSCYALGIALMIALAWHTHSVWALVWGGLFSTMCGTLASHFLLPGAHNRWHWDKNSFHAIFDLGKWLFLSSLLTFFAGEGNKLIIGKLLDVRMLAFYTLASTLAMMFWQITTQLSSKILLPAYSEIIRINPEKLQAALTRTRMYMVIPGYFIALAMMWFGQPLVDLIYDERYAEAGKMLILLSMGMFPVVIRGSYLGVLTAKGMVKANTILLAITIGVQIMLMYLGYHWLGKMGVVAAFAAANWLLAIPFAVAYHKAGCWQPRMDIPLMLLALLLVGARLLTLDWLAFGFK